MFHRIVGFGGNEIKETKGKGERDYDRTKRGRNTGETR
jgi:hypothetical protein